MDDRLPETAAAVPVAIGAPRWSRDRASSVATQAALCIAAIVGSLLVYLPYRHDMSPVYAFWDGPSYLMIAHDLYEVRPGNPLAPDRTKPPYYASHLPGYPLLVRVLSFVGYQRALLAGSVLPAIAAVLLFYRLARDVWKLPSPGFLSLVFLFLPPHWVLYRSVGATESLFIALVLASIFFFEKKQLGMASIAAGLASFTRFSGLLILPAYAYLILRTPGRRRSLLWLAVIPVGVTLYFLYFIARFGDALQPIERNLELFSSLVPFWDVTRINSWPAGQASEFYILLTLVYAIGTLRLWKKYPVAFAYCGLQMLFCLFLSGADWARLYLAMAPFALILGFHDLLNTRAFRWAFPVFALLSVYWAGKIIPFNGCRNFDRILAYLGLG